MNILLTQLPQVFELGVKSMTRQGNKPFRAEMSSEDWRNLVYCLAETSGLDPV